MSPCPPWTASRPIPWARCTRCWCSSGPVSSRRPGGSATPCSRTPAGAVWRTAAAAAHRALGQDDAAVALAAEQLALARKGGSEITLGIALRAHGDLAEAVSVLEATPARYELALALADHGASLRRCGQRTRAREPRLRALDRAERTGAAALTAEVKR